MKRWIAVLLAVLTAWRRHSGVRAGTRSPGPGTVVVTIIPAAPRSSPKAKDTQGPSFGNYELGGASRSTSIATSASKAKSAARSASRRICSSPAGTSNLKTPTLLNYSGNLVVSAPNRSSVVPYVTGGVGGLTLFDDGGARHQRHRDVPHRQRRRRREVVCNGRWGLRGDYRFIAVQSKDDAPAFFGQENALRPPRLRRSADQLLRLSEGTDHVEANDRDAGRDDGDRRGPRAS